MAHLTHPQGRNWSLPKLIKLSAYLFVVMRFFPVWPLKLLHDGKTENFLAVKKHLLGHCEEQLKQKKTQSYQSSLGLSQQFLVFKALFYGALSKREQSFRRRKPNHVAFPFCSIPFRALHGGKNNYDNGCVLDTPFFLDIHHFQSIFRADQTYENTILAIL